ncbi:MAG: acetyl-CoA carboxylase biotin carboxylase subunit [Candidatus Omnitrophica bacterium]|nr:acetyl-CoA carboxylase biotin carboxylase subunit [Candidatus Omnitrophota bacterium]
MFGSILIANRGEIAVRIIRACKELGVKSVAVFSKADAESMHVHLADQAICIGGNTSVESYLNIPAIISAAEIADVEAIHPGYGFLAENTHFAEICESCQIKFIGPLPDSVKKVGDKAVARDVAKAANVPVIPGSDSVVKDKNEALTVAKKLGYPVIIKAKAGGGGKGMKVAHNDGALISAFLTAQAEAEAAFGEPDLYIEKFIKEPRHIEFQILGDSRGHVIHLGERDCTIQRRYQKLLEESPSPVLDRKTRRKMGECAVRIAKSIKYEGAGTVEFLLDENNNFYFIEMNARIQVEHPVTEMITGIDLVKEQIKIASGERLKLTQDNVQLKGWAIECRINAEDPDNNFMPCPGKIDQVIFPGGPGVRVDSHVYPGYYIAPYYDSMILKLITYGKDRNEAIAKMRRALAECTIQPLKTTIPLHQAILETPKFLRGKYSTSFIETAFRENQNKKKGVKTK